MAKPKRGLGKGLEAIFADNETADVAVRELSINEIEPNAGQPRVEFSQEAINQLAESIGEHGVLQPLLVRPLTNGRYQIVCGERRWRASRIAGLTEVPVVVRELTDVDAYEIALVENLVREDLNPMEEAKGYETLLSEYGLTQEEIAKRVGRSRSAVANALRLLGLPSSVMSLVSKGVLSAGHGRALLSLSSEDAELLAKKILAEDMSVRATEQFVKALKADQTKTEKKTPPTAPTYYREMEIALKQTLSRRVKVSHKGNGKGEITIEFYSQDELSDLGKKLTENR